MATDKDTVIANMVKGHTAEAKIASLATHVYDLYRMREGGASSKKTVIPRVISCYGESGSTNKDKIYATFIGIAFTAHLVFMNISCGKEDQVEVEVEILRAGAINENTNPLQDIYKKILPAGSGHIELGNIKLDSSDLLNVYATYLPKDKLNLYPVEVTVTIVGDSIS